MKRKVFLSVIIMILVTAIFAGTYLYVNLGSDKYVTVTVQTMADSETVTGYIVKNEEVIDLSGGKFVRFYCEDGDKVSAKSYVASVYNSEEDGNILSEIDAIDEKLENLSDEYVSLTMNDVLKIESYIDSDIDKYFDAVYSGDASEAALTTGRLTTLFNIKHSGKSSNENAERELLRERNALEAKLSSAKSDITTPMGGIFVSKTDGFEGIVDFEKAKEITVGEFDEVMKLKASETQSECKVVDNYRWLFMCKISSDYATLTGISGKVEIITDMGENISGTVEYISQPEEGECIITISSDRDFSGIGKSRKTEATLTFNEYTGYVIPTEAFHLYENKYVVFVESGNWLKFKATEVLYSDDEYTVVNPSGKTELKLYDNVLVEGDLSDLYD
ncbi:MAG: HlyD family efflux transporter periplasmic adaptor subunit [Clostridia bacterium]|nr:HlyD family efflux transporter periplasmic adaptor subunit [Clostridia bacterium]